MRKNRFMGMLAVLLIMLLAGGIAASAEYMAEFDDWYGASGSWEETDEGWYGEGGQNGYYISNIQVSGKQDFTIAVSVTEDPSHAVAGAGIAVLEDDLYPEAVWYCFQVQASDGSVTMFHIEDGVMKWQENASLSDEQKALETHQVKLVYTAATHTLEGYVDDTLLITKVDENFGGWLALKRYEAPAVFSEIVYTGAEAPTPVPVTPTPDVTEAPATETPSAGNDPTAAPSASSGADKTTAPQKTSAPGQADAEEAGVNVTVVVLVAVAVVLAAGILTFIIVKKKSKS